MSNLSEIVDSLENRVTKVLRRYQKVQRENLDLLEELNSLKEQQAKSEEQIEEWKEKFGSLKLANSLLGSDQHKRDTKLKINALVREIDQCINQLTE